VKEDERREGGWQLSEVVVEMRKENKTMSIFKFAGCT